MPSDDPPRARTAFLRVAIMIVPVALFLFAAVLVGWSELNSIERQVRHLGGKTRFTESSNVFEKIVLGINNRGSSQIFLDGTTVDDTWFARNESRLRELPGLELLLRDTDVSDATLEILSRLPNLRTVSVEETAITGKGLRHLVDLPDLTGLVVANTETTDQELGELKNFPRVLAVGIDAGQASEIGLSHLDACRSLSSLRLVNATDEVVSRIQSRKIFTSLVLIGPEVTDASVPILLSMEQLDSLSLIDTSVSRNQADRLRAAFPTGRFYFHSTVETH